MTRGRTGVLVGGRLTVEDSYAYAKFARVALDTNDVDFRARVHSCEEADFLAAHLPGSGLAAGDLAPEKRSNETLSAESMDLLRGFRAAFHEAKDKYTDHRQDKKSQREMSESTAGGPYDHEK